MALLSAHNRTLSPATDPREVLRADCFANHVFACVEAVETALTNRLVALETNPDQSRSITRPDQSLLYL